MTIDDSPMSNSVNPGFLLVVASYNIGASPSIWNVITFLSEEHSVTVLLLDVDGNWGALTTDRPLLNIITLDGLLDTPEKLALIRQLYTDRTVVVAFDPHGFCLAMCLFPESRPFYYSLELYLENDHSGLDYPDDMRVFERSHINKIRGLIIQSSERELLFRSDYQLSTAIPAFLLPVTSRKRTNTQRTDYLHRKYEIPQDCRIALHLGGINWWFSCIELAVAFAGIEGWYLLFQGNPHPDYKRELLETIRERHILNVIVSDEFFDDMYEVDKVVACCDVGIAWYNNISEGFRTAGLSSGKIASYTQFGLPTIAKRYNSTEIAIENSGSGVCVDGFNEIPEAVKQISVNYEYYAANAKRTFEELFNFDNYAQPFLKFICAEVGSTQLATQDYWDAVYDDMRLAIAAHNDPVRKWIEKYVPCGTGACLEIGAFPGRYLAVFGMLGYELHGIDLTPRVITDLPRWLKDCGFKVGTFHRSDFNSFDSMHTYDIVSSFGFIEHFINWEHVLLRHAHMVSDGGLLIIETPNFAGKLQKYLHSIFDSENMARHCLDAMSPEKWEITIAPLGFELIFSGWFGGFDFWREPGDLTIQQSKDLEWLDKLVPLLRSIQEDDPSYSPYCGLIARKLPQTPVDKHGIASEYVADRPCQPHNHNSTPTQKEYEFQNYRCLLSLGRNQILLVVASFWPSIGGIETITEQLATQLIVAGYDVTIITAKMPGRNTDYYQGIKIKSLDATILTEGIPEWLLKIREEVTSGNYKAAIIIQDPLGDIIWSVEGAAIPAQSQLIIQPVINDEGFSKWQNNDAFSNRLSNILKNAGSVVTMTRSGVDSKFMKSRNIPFVYIPNAVSVSTPSVDFRARYGISASTFLILHVANLYWVKNHVGLLDALAGMPPEWQLVMVGHASGEIECARYVLQHLKKFPQVLYIPGLPREEVAAAMAAADVVVLASHGEGSPVSILEAMAHGKPWLATPACGAATENAGGIICNLSEFQENLAVFAEYPEIRKMLGEAGYQHWQACMSWPQVVKGWVDLIEGHALHETFQMPANVEEMMSTLKQAIENAKRSIHQKNMAVVSHAAQKSDYAMETSRPIFVNIAMVTYNRLEYTRQAIEALRLRTNFPHALTVVDNNSQDGTREYLQALRKQGVIKNLVLLDENVGLAKATNLAWSLEPEAAYLMRVDNDIVMQRDGWLKDMVDVFEQTWQLGVLGYSLEPVSYPLVQLENGIALRVKNGNVGGGCMMISRRVFDTIGYLCEEYGLYGEDDADYGARVMVCGLLNAYMPDEDAAFHLPGGKAAVIDPLTLASYEGGEEELHAEYRAWKDTLRQKNVLSGHFSRNLQKYRTVAGSYHLKSRFVTEFWHRMGSGEAGSGRKESVDDDVLVSIIIPVFNQVELTRVCLETILSEASKGVEIIVVDNGSNDGAKEYLRKLRGRIRLIENHRNRGFARACNQGAVAAAGRYLVFLNNDTVPQPGWLDALLQPARAGEADVVGAKLLYPDATIQHAGVVFDQQGPLHCCKRMAADAPMTNQPRYLQAVTAACMLISAELFQQLGGFDEGYKNGFEDIDLCLSAVQRGCRVYYQPASVLIHHEESSEGRKRYDEENYARFLRRWIGRWQIDHASFHAPVGIPGQA